MRALAAWMAFTAFMVVVGCASVKPGVREANVGPAFQPVVDSRVRGNDGLPAPPADMFTRSPVRQAACWYCLKPRTDVEREYLRRWRDGLDAILGDRK